MHDNINVFNALVSFLKKEYKYKAINTKNLKEGKVVLVNKTYKYQLIQLELQNSLAILSDQEVSAIKNFTENNVEVLKIVISQTENQRLTVEGDFLVIKTTPTDLKNNLMEIFEKINKINLSQVEDSPNKATNNRDDLNDELKLKHFKLLLNKIKNNNIRFTWIILGLFIVLPAAFTIIGTFLGLNVLVINNGVQESAPGAAQIIFGGINQSLVVLGHQWWRVLTYGFSAIDTGNSGIIMDIFFVLIFCTALFSVSRLTEIVIGSVWKMALPFGLAYVALGFISATTLPYTITSGTMPIIGIMTGILAMYITGEKTPIAQFSRAKLVWPMALLILVVFTSDDQASSFAILFLGVVLGSIFTALTKVHPKSWAGKEHVMLALFTGLMIIGIVFAIITKNIPAYNNSVLAAFQFYGKNNLGGNYGSYTKLANQIGWQGAFDTSTGNWKKEVGEPLMITLGKIDVQAGLSLFDLKKVLLWKD